MSETTDSPEVADEVVDAAPARALALASLRRDALAELTAFEAGMAKLEQEHGSTDYDITTAFGLKLATTRRHAIRLVRYRVPKAVKAKKAELKEVVGALETEGERIEGLLQALEDKHDALIKAEEVRKAAIAAEAVRVAAEKKAEEDRIEAERQARHQGGIAKIRSFLARCQEPGMTSARIAAGISALMSVMVGEEWEDFKDEANTAKEQTLDGMRQLCAKTMAGELAEEAAEAARIENERKAAMLAAAAAELEQRKQAFEAEMAEAKRVLSERMQAEEAQRAALAAEIKPEAVPVGEVIEHQELEAKRIADLESGAPKPGDDEPPEDAYLPATAPAVQYVAPTDDSPTLRLPVFGERLGFPVSGTLLSMLGIEPAGKEGRAILYRQSDWARFCDALIKHITTAKEAA